MYREFIGAEVSGKRTMSTYPDIRLVNTSQKTISEFIIMIKSADGTGRGVLMKNQSIQPGATLIFPSAKWAKPERLMTQKDGKFVPVIRELGLDSPKSWLPGAASGSKVAVGMVTFGDGVTWMAPDDPTW